VAALEDEVTRIARALIDELDGDDEIDLAGGFAKRLPVLVICGLMGLPAQDAAMLKGWGDDVLECADGTGTGDQARMAGASLSAYWSEQLADRRRSPRGDLIGQMAQANLEPDLEVALRLLLSRWPDFDVAEAERFHDVTLRTFKHPVIRVA
jgi:cytochrome P450